MATILELVKNANFSEEGATFLKQELEKFKIFLDKDIGLFSPGELSNFLTLLTTAKNNLSVKTIRMTAQLEEKEKDLNNKTAEILNKYGVKNIQELEEKEKSIRAELDKQISELKEVLENIKSV